MENKIANTAWFGKELTNIQRLCIRSYQDAGHEVHLWCPVTIRGVPKGTPDGAVIRDSGSIVSLDRLEQFAHNSQASDLFRLLLIQAEGGWWIDADTICLRPFDFPEDYAFVSEVQLGQRLDPRIHRVQKPVSEQVTSYISNSTFKMPKNAPVLRYMIDKINAMDVAHPEEWITMGPALFSEAIPKFGLQQYVKSPIIFDSFNYDEIYMFVSSGIQWNISPKSYAAHLRTSCWLGPNFKCPPYGDRDIPVYLDADGRYPEDSLFEQLKRKHGI